MSAKVEVEKTFLFQFLVLVMFFPSGFPNTVSTLKPLNRDRLYLLLCRTWNYSISNST